MGSRTFPLTNGAPGSVSSGVAQSSIRYLYLHLPFCDVICHYCHFYTARSQEADSPAFFSALSRHARQTLSELGPQLEAVYFGGGTPGASPPELVAQVLETLKPKLTQATEITLETNPTNVDSKRMGIWKAAGVNRISLGVQSLEDATLKKLGRAHTSAQARAALEILTKEFPRVSCDIIYGVPGQSAESPKAHALELLKLGASHLSFYHLTLEKSHFLHSRLPDDAFAWDQLRLVADALEQEGLHHYEVASFARPGMESRNNLNYWGGGAYEGLGPSAHGFDGENRRWTNVSDWKEYVRRLESGEDPRAWTEELSLEQRKLEVLFTSLRTSRGIELDTFEKQFGVNIVAARKSWIDRWEKEGLLLLRPNQLSLTFRGRMLADEIARILS